MSFVRKNINKFSLLISTITSLIILLIVPPSIYSSSRFLLFQFFFISVGYFYVVSYIFIDVAHHLINRKWILDRYESICSEFKNNGYLFYKVPIYVDDVEYVYYGISKMDSSDSSRKAIDSNIIKRKLKKLQKGVMSIEEVYNFVVKNGQYIADIKKRSLESSKIFKIKVTAQKGRVPENSIESGFPPARE